ncbi:hypothetical protein PK98_15175 [Croceibacterium mercuriale]|uniref:Uncharacterized protein n=1 Tax=Croceibacterium mercuriale TaxID=1572751 RepID=A0A0B2BSC5_9SPHN|nr:hypothetical protein [Croceibacterium mercuriale]KHL24299.1 hypothetical protein PK98_15175 [Croceibacterium mercuriale]
MLVTFRIVDTQSRLHTKPATITARELAKLVAMLRDYRMVIDPDEGEIDHLPTNFEFNANSIALAKLSGLFDWRDDIIAIVEEGQFLGRTLRVERALEGTDIQLRVSEHIALASDMTLREDTAEKLFAAIGINPAARTSISIDRLSDLLRQPTMAKAFDDLEIRTIYDQLTMTVTTDCGEQQPRLTWA